MKLSEIEQILQQGNITEETISAFKGALKHAPKSSRCQHCYATAAAFPREKWKEAISLICYGLDACESSWVDQMRSYCNMATIYEAACDYPNALCAYQNALNAVKKENRRSYVPSLSADMLRAELHCSGFQYTDALYHYYNQSVEQDSFSKSFTHRQFYEAIAEMLIFTHRGESARANEAYIKAKNILSPSHEGPLKNILMRHKYADSAKATKEAIQFLKSWNK